MTQRDEIIQHLLDKIDLLAQRQDSFLSEIQALKEEIKELRIDSDLTESSTVIHQAPPPIKKEDTSQDALTPRPPAINIPPPIQRPPDIPAFRPQPPRKSKSEMEQFIGSNLINKIGIAITIIGVAIGAKYSIDHDLISPLARIVLGYVIAMALLGVGFKLKKTYTDFSAVLVSGAMAIMYFITYAAYSFYSLFPQLAAFSLMVLFTIMAIVAALNYNRQVIAHIGLVGAYAVPFLLSENAGNITILYSYMAIINIGVLIISVKKYWKPLYYASFILTWNIFGLWYLTEYQTDLHYTVFWIFAFLFFLTFYLIFISYKLLHQEKFKSSDVLLILTNSFIFYGLGYSVLANDPEGGQLLGLFTLGNAAIHLAVTLFIYQQKTADRNLFSMVAGLVLIFITIAIPVQLDGSWVTLLWAGEAALLFWIGRKRNDPIYEKISYALMMLAFFSIAGDWMSVYNQYVPGVPETRMAPLLNINFLTSLVFISAFAFMTYLNRSTEDTSAPVGQNSLNPLMRVVIPAILLITLYYTFSLEITMYWHQLYLDSAKTLTLEGNEYESTYWNEDLVSFKYLWNLNYSFLFLTLLAFINIKWIKSKQLALTTLIFGFITIIVFLSEGLWALSTLRDNYLTQYLSEHYPRSSFNIGIRYTLFVFAGMMLYALYRILKEDDLEPRRKNLRIAFDLLFHFTILCVISNEWLTWMAVLQFSESTRLGLSIIWGVYALWLIVLGIWKAKGHLRIMAIALFAVTLIKLAVYDISHLNTIAKTIVFVTLGVLLLIISFLYNKYKHLTLPEERENVRE
ncbi:MAG TPA: DUF2339 domain-containing protein [Saprospiraceae bacterium]|nr:DUF2339 domain-containing protein [Saprospiraceae bacterium]